MTDPTPESTQPVSNQLTHNGIHLFGRSIGSTLQGRALTEIPIASLAAAAAPHVAIPTDPDALQQATEAAQAIINVMSAAYPRIGLPQAQRDMLPDPTQLPVEVATVVRQTSEAAMVHARDWPPQNWPAVPNKAWPPGLFQHYSIQVMTLELIQYAVSALWCEIAIGAKNHKYCTVEPILSVVVCHHARRKLGQAALTAPRLTPAGEQLLKTVDQADFGTTLGSPQQTAAHTWLQGRLSYLPKHRHRGISDVELWWLVLQTTSYLSGLYTKPSEAFISWLQGELGIEQPVVQPASITTRRQLG